MKGMSHSLSKGRSDDKRPFMKGCSCDSQCCLYANTSDVLENMNP